MTRLNLLASAVVLALAATAGGSAFGAGYASWAVKPPGRIYGSIPAVAAEFKRHLVSGVRFERGHRRGFRKPRRRGFRRRHRYWPDRYFFSFAFPLYGYYRYDRYDYPYVPPPAAAPSAGPAPVPDESSACREIVMDVIIGGVEQKAYGTACQQADGSWKITN